MRSTLTPRLRRRAGVLYAGVILFVLLAAFTARTVWRVWDERAGQARTAAVFELVQQRTPSRPVEAPGAIAWLREQLTAYRSHLEPRDAEAFDRLAHETDRLPPELERVADVMRTAMLSTGPRDLPNHVAFGETGSSRRAVSLWSASGRTFVVTRRHGLENDVSSNEFVARVLHPIASVRERLDEALRGVARPVRLYALGEDGTLVSLPWPSSAENAADAARSEARQLSTRPTLPSFAPEEFFFRFAEDERDSVRYSGFYVDLGGRGLVSTLTLPMADANQAGVLALDLSHPIDWDHFASTIPAPLAASIVHTRSDASARWSTLRAAVSDAAPASLRAALDDVT